MIRCFIKPDDWKKAEIILAADESHHLLSVLRARRDETISLTDGKGRIATGHIASAGKDRAVVRIAPGTIRFIQRFTPALTLVQAVPKHSIMDTIIEKAVELGASAIIPMISERVIVRLDRAKSEKRLERWRKIAKEAAKQSGAAWLLDIKPLCALDEIPSLLPENACFLAASLQQNAVPMRDALPDAAGSKDLALAIGPEGDFTESEYAFLHASGAKPVSFGPLVLRVDTAAVFGMSMVAGAFAGTGTEKQIRE
jgi:16S rRNA (uracil1498-N3)-methyltransferase